MRVSDARRHVSFILLHPYVSFFAHAALNSPRSSLSQVCGFFVAGRVCLIVLALALPVANSFFGLITVYYCRRHLSSQSVGVLSS